LALVADLDLHQPGGLEEVEQLDQAQVAAQTPDVPFAPRSRRVMVMVVLGWWIGKRNRPAYLG
jgi:hypothetical protein